MTAFDLIIVRDEEEAESAEVFVDGTIGGRAYRFLLDTGAAQSAVGYDDYTATFSSSAKSSSSGVFASSSDDLITVPSLEVGPISKRDVTLVRLAERSPNSRNILGMDLLKDFCCHFQFAENRVSVEAADELEQSYPFQALFLDRKFHPYVELQFGAAQAKAVWDTGASLTIADIRFIESHPAYFQEVGRAMGTDSTGSQMDTPMFIMTDAVIGGSAFPPHKAAGVDLSHVNSTTDIPMDLILGYSTLRQAEWVFDFPGKRWAVKQR